jgi:hypothetical protein
MIENHAMKTKKPMPGGIGFFLSYGIYFKKVAIAFA